MTISVYEVTIPVFQRNLLTLSPRAVITAKRSHPSKSTNPHYLSLPFELIKAELFCFFQLD